MTHGIIIRLVLALFLIALGGYVAVMNWAMMIQSHRTGRFHSAVPLVGALFLGAGLTLLPATRHYAWAAIMVDYGTLMLLYALPGMIREAWETSRYNLIAEYRGSQGIMTACISLYRDGIFIIQHDFKRAPGEMGTVHRSNIGTWSQDGQRLTLQVGDASAGFEVVTEGTLEVLRQVTGFSWENSREVSLVGVELRRQGSAKRQAFQK